MQTIQNPRVQAVTPLLNYSLLLKFDNGEQKIFDVTPYLDKGIFRVLRNQSIFASVNVVLGSVQWSNGADFCPDTLYLESSKVSHIEEILENYGLAKLMEGSAGDERLSGLAARKYYTSLKNAV
jgi:Protein of unknown function (DUF2442)/RelB Antitoxin alpha helical domain